MDHSRIAQNPAVMSGKPCIAGTRVTAEALTFAVASQGSLEAAAATYGVPVGDVRAAVCYAADALRLREERDRLGLPEDEEVLFGFTEDQPLEAAE